MKNRLSWFSIPYVVWMALFTVIPILMMVFYAFTVRAQDPETLEWSIRFTLDNFAQMGGYFVVFLRSFKLALVATVICLLIGYPISYLMAREGPRFQKVAMALIMLPMWMNFLLRTYAWMSILENTGLLNRLFAAVGIIDLGNLVNAGLNGLCAALNGAFGLSLDTARSTAMTYFPMINTQGAVVLGMVYNYLPFMILPIYSVIVKLDNSLLEAARDLGAGSARVFRKVIFPLSLPGVLSGITMVGTAYNPYLGSAISLVMMVVVVVCMYVMNRFGEGEEQAVIL